MTEDAIPVVRSLIMSAIHAERMRQERLKAAGKFVFSCADAGISDLGRLAVLTEEVGEVAHELNEQIGKPARRQAHFDSQARLRDELIQVAAVCVAWLEAIDDPKPLFPKESL